MSPVRITTNARTRILVAMFAAPLLAISVASCASGAASDADDSKSAPKSESELAKSALAWDTAKAECLRGEGIDVPDPKGGSGGGQGIALDAGQDMAALSAAMQTCQKKVTDEHGERPVTAAEKKQNAEGIEKSRKMSACLREKGYDMPDPEAKPGGGGTITSEVGPEIPEDVMKACGMVGGATTQTRR